MPKASSKASYLRGRVYWVELDPSKGAEITKTRPCVILSTNEVNQHRKTVVVVPLTTTKTPAIAPLLLATPSMGEDSKARIEHIRGIDKSRIKAAIGDMGTADLSAIEEALRRVLRLNQV
jgi:mRNA interferase MazF